MKYGYIYKITNLVNGKIYVGQHKYSKEGLDLQYTGSGKLLSIAKIKYGIENFHIELLEECETKEQLNEREISWIKELNSMDSQIGYNLTSGGDGGSEPGPHNWSEAGIENIRKANSHPHTSEHNKKISEGTSRALKGKPHTQEWHQHVVESKRKNGSLGRGGNKKGCVPWNKGLTKEDPRVAKNTKSRLENGNIPDFSGENNPFYGKKHTDEAKEKNRIAHVGKPSSTKGKICIHKDSVCKYVDNEHLEEWNIDGWELGGLTPKNNVAAQMRWYTNGELGSGNNLYLKLGEPIPEGFYPGRTVPPRTNHKQQEKT